MRAISEEEIRKGPNIDKGVQRHHVRNALTKALTHSGRQGQRYRAPTSFESWHQHLCGNLSWRRLRLTRRCLCLEAIRTRSAGCETICMVIRLGKCIPVLGVRPQKQEETRPVRWYGYYSGYWCFGEGCDSGVEQRRNIRLRATGDLECKRRRFVVKHKIRRTSERLGRSRRTFDHRLGDRILRIFRVEYTDMKDCHCG